MAVLAHDSTKPKAAAGDWTRLLSSPWMLAPIVALAFLAYAPTLNDWFAGDDFWFLDGARSSSWAEYLRTSFDPRQTQPDYEFNRYRPLYPLAWKLQYEIFGLQAFWYHAVVLALHLACVVLAWFVFRRLLGEGGLANLATAIFALHPAYADAVAWISGGNRVFAALPYIASLLLFMKYRDEDEQRPALMYAGSVALFAVALMMHSSTITLVAVLAVYVFFVAGKPRDALEWRAWVPMAPFAALTAGTALVQLYVRDHIGADGFSIGTHMFANYGWAFGMLAVPVETLTTTSRLESLAERVQVVAGFVLIGTTFAVAYRRPLWGLGVFTAAWFVLAYLPDSTFLITQGRTLYVPNFAGALLIVATIIWARDLLPAVMRERAATIAPYVIVASVVVAAFAVAGRTRGTSDAAAEYKSFATALRETGPQLTDGGTLYIVGAPRQGPFSPPSQVASLARLYYGDVNVVVIAPGQPTPPLQANDALFTYTR